MQYLIETVRAKKLDRVAIAYSVGAWIVVQAAAIAAPAFSWPAWGLKAVIVVCIAGLPIVLLGTWTVGVRDEAGGAFRPSRADLHVLGALAVVLVLAGATFVWAFWPRASAPIVSLPEPAAAAPANSVAVLPFANLSGDPAKQYFSDGISDELINELSRIPALRVVARTSSFAFANKHSDIKSIAGALGVRNILEGSIRLSANHVRIEAALVNAASGFNIWSERYDRDLTDILVMQDDIAKAVVLSLEAKVQSWHLVPKQPIDPQAYNLYLQAKTLSSRGNLEDDRKALALLKQATARAPAYANGFALLGHVERDLADLYDKTEFYAAAQSDVAQALRLDPTNLHALSVQNFLALDRWDWNASFAILKKVQAINPNGAVAQAMRGEIGTELNYPDVNLSAEIKVAALNPLSAAPKYNIALFYLNHGKYDDAVRAFHEVLKVRHGKLTDLNLLCSAEAYRRNFAEAHRLMNTLAALYKSDAESRLDCPFVLAVMERDFASARKIADFVAADTLANGGSFVIVGDAYRQIGDLKSAMPWYERAYVARDSLLLLVPFEGWQTPEPLVSYPAWKSLWSRKPVQEWLAARSVAGRILASK